MKMKKMFGNLLTKDEMKKINGGFPPGCVALGGLCVVGRPSTVAGGCCAPYYCSPDHQGGNNAGHCVEVVTQQ